MQGKVSDVESFRTWVDLGEDNGQVVLLNDEFNQHGFPPGKGAPIDTIVDVAVDDIRPYLRRVLKTCPLCEKELVQGWWCNSCRRTLCGASKAKRLQDTADRVFGSRHETKDAPGWVYALGIFLFIVFAILVKLVH